MTSGTNLTSVFAWDQTAELTEIVRSMSRDEGIEPSTLKISAEGFEGKSPGSDDQQSGFRPGSQQQSGNQSEKQQSDKESEKQQQQSEQPQKQAQSQAGGQQGSSAGRGSGGAAQKESKSQAGGGKPESVVHLVEALKEAHVDDPDPPAAQP